MSNGSGLFGDQGPALPHLVHPGGGLSGEISDLRSDLGRVMGGMAALTVDEFVDPAAADPNGIKTSIASAASVQTYLVADLDGVLGAGEMVPPRNPTITTTLHADIDAVVVVVVGKVRNSAGELIDQTGAITLTDGGGVTDAEDSGLAFSTIEKYTVPAQSGTGGALEFGWGDVIGLGKPLVSRAGAAAVLQEIEAGAVVTTGTFVDAATSAPNGTYTPATVPDALNDYAAYYEYDPTS